MLLNRHLTKQLIRFCSISFNNQNYLLLLNSFQNFINKIHFIFVAGHNVLKFPTAFSISPIYFYFNQLTFWNATNTRKHFFENILNSNASPHLHFKFFPSTKNFQMALRIFSSSLKIIIMLRRVIR